MAQRRKKTQSINWNPILFTLTAIALVGDIISNNNQKELSLWKSQAEKIQSEYNNLREEVDPIWYQKFNSQRQYYEAEIIALNNRLHESKKKADSFLAMKDEPKKSKKNTYIFTLNEFNDIANRLAQAVYDSVDLALTKQELNSYKRVVAAQDTLIKANRTSTNTRNALIKTLGEQIENNESIIKLYEANDMHIDSAWDVVLTICLLLILGLTGYLFFIKKNKFNQPPNSTSSI
jgi:hypothetical protein